MTKTILKMSDQIPSTVRTKKEELFFDFSLKSNLHSMFTLPSTHLFFTSVFFVLFWFSAFFCSLYFLSLCTYSVRLNLTSNICNVTVPVHDSLESVYFLINLCCME